MSRPLIQAEPSIRPTAPDARIQSMDIVRGAVMILMAIDHVRVYSGLPAGGPTAGIFFTRWITHFCAPAFAFLAGTSAFLYARKQTSRRDAARYLLTRGLILVALELTLIRFTWTFNLDYARFTLAGVIWMLGWSMVVLAGLVRLPANVVGILGLAVISFQQLFRLLPHALPASVQHSLGWLWEFVYPAGYEPWHGMAILYVLVPWVGVLAAGYGFGLIMIREARERRRLCLRIGVSAIALFLVAGGIVLQLNPPHGDAPPVWLRLLNQQKYPASQLFLLMTLGPVIVLLALAEKISGWAVRAVATFGNVPLFYYLLHIPAIHIAALVVTWLREGAIHAEWYASAPFTSVPPERRWGLGLLYLVFAAVIAVLYVPCRWFSGLKARHRRSWLKYF